jgi:GntR family transcriptional regulator, gluconate operon transcriptional repressor
MAVNCQQLTMAEAFTPLRPPDTLAQSTAGLLRERLLGGGFAPGERLVEAEIARQLGISRGPVREALAKLRAEGLVYDEPRRGSFVAELSDHDVREIYELRAALEVQAARLLIARDDDAAFARLGEVMDDLRAAAASGDHEAFARQDAFFHDELCRLSDNGRLHRAFVQQAELLNTLLRLEVTTQYSSLDDLLEQHEHLYAELASRDEDRARAACDEHMRHATEHVLAMRAQAAAG